MSIKEKLFQNLDLFINEIDLTMEYIKKSQIMKIRNFIDKLKNDENSLGLFSKNTIEDLREYEIQISTVVLSSKKIKSDYLDFFQNIHLFDNLLTFDIFDKECKNTKIGLLKYLHSIYMSCSFLHLEQNDLELKSFISKIKKEAEDNESSATKPKLHLRRNAICETPNEIPNEIPSEMFNGMQDIMKTIMGNKQIVNIASDISSQMQKDNINPMMMLSSIMSGNIQDGPLGNLFGQIQQKVEKEINTGNLNTDILQQQSEKILKSLNTNNIADLMQNLMTPN